MPSICTAAARRPTTSTTCRAGPLAFASWAGQPWPRATFTFRANPTKRFPPSHLGNASVRYIHPSPPDTSTAFTPSLALFQSRSHRQYDHLQGECLAYLLAVAVRRAATPPYPPLLPSLSLHPPSSGHHRRLCSALAALQTLRHV
jgi:hypothetical protein